MKYSDGIEVQAGDVVLVQRSKSSMEGVIVKIIQPNTEESHHWYLPDGGVLIEGGGFGLSATKSLEEDEDIVFVRRGKNIGTRA
jgi:hypothetical protein